MKFADLTLPLDDEELLGDSAGVAANSLAGPAFNLYDLTVLDPEKLEEAVRVFRAEAHRSGAEDMMSISNLRTVFEQLDITSPALAGILCEAEEAGQDSGPAGFTDKKIGLDEFLALVRAVFMESADLGEEETRIRSAFAHIDKDNNSLLDLDEFTLALAMLGRRDTPEQIEMAFKRVDSDNSGAIDYDEFAAYITQERSMRSAELNEHTL